ncbi:MAG: restriction endonuclease [Acidobacteria bacterium]|nr:restriction endonuclease [Acidobacteriota bacterium]
MKPSALIDTRVIYCGDNLDQLAKLPDACVDLIYIDPPFNSNRNYEVFWGETKEKRSFEDRHASSQAYIEFMRPRCVQLARVLKPTGSFYYHCDWHASHYIKVMLDQLFGENCFLNEIVWKRSDAHNDATLQFPVVSDSIFLYSGGGKYTFVPQHVGYPTKTLKEWYLWLEFPDGTTRRMTKDEIATQVIQPGARRFNTADLSAPAGGGMAAINAKTGKPNGWYIYKGYQPPGRGWRHEPERMAENDRKGLLLFPPDKSGRIMFKRYLDEQQGPVLGNVWTDIDQLRANDAERLGYPTQKPLALLDRIIKASSKENDIVLDAFCGCGTALVAAQKLKRQWIGIDVSPTACRVMAKRLRDICGLREGVLPWQDGHGFIVLDLPWSEEKLRKLPPFEFENWAVIALGGIPNKVQVGDMGIDGRIYPVSASPDKKTKATGHLEFMDVWYPVQVKQKDKVGRPDIDSFEAMMTRSDRTKGFFVSFDYSSDAMREIGAFFKKSGKVIVPLTVREILDEQIAQKLA